MNHPITLALICEILNHSIHDADCIVEGGYIWISTESQTVRISLDFIRKG